MSPTKLPPLCGGKLRSFLDELPLNMARTIWYRLLTLLHGVLLLLFVYASFHYRIRTCPPDKELSLNVLSSLSSATSRCKLSNSSSRQAHFALSAWQQQIQKSTCILCVFQPRICRLPFTDKPVSRAKLAPRDWPPTAPRTASTQSPSRSSQPRPRQTLPRIIRPRTSVLTAVPVSTWPTTRRHACLPVAQL